MTADTDPTGWVLLAPELTPIGNLHNGKIPVGYLDGHVAVKDYVKMNFPGTIPGSWPATKYIAPAVSTWNRCDHDFWYEWGYYYTD